MNKPFNAGAVAGSDAKAMQKLVRTWLATPVLRKLVEDFGGTWPTDRKLAVRLSRLEKFSEVWDCRGGRERFDAKGVSFNDDRLRLIAQSAHDLGLLLAAKPAFDHYDYAVVLGGTATSCLLRARLVCDLQRDGLRFGRIIFLGSERPISAAEREMADTYALPGAETEYDLLMAAAEAEFGVRIEEGDPEFGDSGELAWRFDGYYITVINVPAGDSSRRTNTADQYKFLAEHYPLEKDKTILLATSQIYYPFHLFGALADLALPTGAAVEVTGYPVEWAEGRSALRAPQNVLQEIRSALRAAQLLVERLEARQ